MAEPERTEPQIDPLEAHISALRAELVRTQMVIRLTTGTLALVALALVWQAIRARPA